jgi:hypothetical protein
MNAADLLPQGVTIRSHGKVYQTLDVQESRHAAYAAAVRKHEAVIVPVYFYARWRREFGRLLAEYVLHVRYLASRSELLDHGSSYSLEEMGDTLEVSTRQVQRIHTFLRRPTPELARDLGVRSTLPLEHVHGYLVLHVGALCTLSDPKDRRRSRFQACPCLQEIPHPDDHRLFEFLAGQGTINFPEVGRRPVPRPEVPARRSPAPAARAGSSSILPGTAATLSDGGRARLLEAGLNDPQIRRLALTNLARTERWAVQFADVAAGMEKREKPIRIPFRFIWKHVVGECACDDPECDWQQEFRDAELARKTAQRRQEREEQRRVQQRQEAAARSVPSDRTPPELRERWTEILDRAAARIGREPVESWLKDCSLTLCSDGQAVVAVPNLTSRTWIEKKYLPALAEAAGVPVILRLEKEPPHAPRIARETLSAPPPARALPSGRPVPPGDDRVDAGP